MKRFVGILKLMFYYLLGYVVFTTIISLVECLFLLKLGGDGVVIKYVDLFIKSARSNLASYSIVFLMIVILNVLYNYIIIKKLNKNLSKIKKGWLLWKIKE